MIYQFQKEQKCLYDGKWNDQQNKGYIERSEDQVNEFSKTTHKDDLETPMNVVESN